MATVSAKVYEHHKKADDTYNVKICVHHKSERKFIDTNHYVVKKQLTKDYKIKDSFIADKVEQQLREYRKVISDLDDRLIYFTAESLRDFLRDKDEDIDFVKFCDNHISRLRQEGRTRSADNHRVVRNSLIDFFNRESFSINEIHVNMLMVYERYLRSERTMTRINQFGRPVTKTVKGVSDAAIHNYMRDLRTLFNAARDHYNNEDMGLFRIKHYPFKKYKVGSAPSTRNRNNTLEEVLVISNCVTTPGSRAELAKELYMLSFFLCGMNAVDLYQLNPQDIRNGRVDYNRSKTKGKRKDNAFISIKVVDEAKPLLEKYISNLKRRYSSIGCFNKALSKGMDQLCRLTNLSGVTFYWARHTFATVARNDCRVSKDDVALALNHVDEGNRTTDIYIAKDWKIVDDVQRKVIAQLRKTEIKVLKKAQIKKGTEKIAA
ncbi:site-specific integrase [Parapedobacter indicus]|uniref:Phage integrase SAM-like domain-containing protein n=1 Tax=Parapedobacter indicus TaxID=1477437 RepID=A0A1I3JCS7_9SPHI|nr:site-specific integrase [Parapedobacter indicus]PPL02462.1 integrase-like protein [Parapedobacter indicus]SFI57755.1 Phage integrase SAM-like domain-containing protein [Parapedobacter indicus]